MRKNKSIVIFIAALVIALLAGCSATTKSTAKGPLDGKVVVFPNIFKGYMFDSVKEARAAANQITEADGFMGEKFLEAINNEPVVDETNGFKAYFDDDTLEAADEVDGRIVPNLGWDGTCVVYYRLDGNIRSHDDLVRVLDPMVLTLESAPIDNDFSYGGKGVFTLRYSEAAKEAFESLGEAK